MSNYHWPGDLAGLKDKPPSLSYRPALFTMQEETDVVDMVTGRVVLRLSGSVFLPTATIISLPNFEGQAVVVGTRLNTSPALAKVTIEVTVPPGFWTHKPA